MNVNGQNSMGRLGVHDLHFSDARHLLHQDKGSRFLSALIGQLALKTCGESQSEEKQKELNQTVLIRGYK